MVEMEERFVSLFSVRCVAGTTGVEGLAIRGGSSSIPASREALGLITALKGI